MIEDDDVTALVVVEAGRELVDEHVLIRLERPLHRLLLDPVRLCDEVLDDEEDDEGEDERLDDLEETPEGAFAHKTGSIGGGARRRGRPPRLPWPPAGLYTLAGPPRCCPP